MHFRYSPHPHWFKGNTHIHTNASDGGKTHAEVAALYAAAGFSFLFATDHFIASDFAHAVIASVATANSSLPTQANSVPDQAGTSRQAGALPALASPLAGRRRAGRRGRWLPLPHRRTGPLREHLAQNGPG